MAIRILHIAPENFAGMPSDFVKMHRISGIDSNLVSLYRSSNNFDEDICLNFNLPSGNISGKWRDKKVKLAEDKKLKYAAAGNVFEKLFFSLRDWKNKNTIYEAVEKYGLMNFDVYHFDGGMDLFRDVRFAKDLKKMNKKIVCCYFGSDLRVRGIFKELDKISDLNLSVEYDHLKLHENINYIYFPFDSSSFKIKIKNNQAIKIVHSPTNRKYKGTEKILKVIDELRKERKFEFILLEKMPRNQVLEIKSGCDIAIDQVGGEMGGSGYGKNSLETLSMGIPTITEFSDDYLEFIPENPFIHSTINTLKENLISLIDNEKLREDISRKGKLWAEKYHSFGAVNKMLTEYYIKYEII